MLQAVYKSVTLFFMKAVGLVLCFLASLLFLIVYLLGIIGFFYYVFVGFISVCLWLGVSLGLDYRKIKGFDWLGVDKKESINLENSEVALRVCERYRNGAGYDDIKKEFGYHNQNQVRRKIIEGLDILLKEHSQHNKKLSV
jgi:hypothetical protein